MKAALLAVFISAFVNSWTQQNNLSDGRPNNIEDKFIN